MATQKSKGTRRIANPIETATNSEAGFWKSEATATKQTIKSHVSGWGDDFISQLLGGDSSSDSEIKAKGKHGGEMQAGESIDLKIIHAESRFARQAKQESPQSIRRPDILGGIDYRSEILQGSERLNKREVNELQEQIREIMDELRRLVRSSALLQAEFLEVSVQQPPLNVGKYHLNFFTWLLSVLRQVRMKVEDSGAWLQVVKNKRSQKKYGSMAKKHGTTFTLSNERTAATQTG